VPGPRTFLAPGSGLEQSIGRAEATFRWTRPSDLLRAFNAWQECAKERRWAKEAGRLAIDRVGMGTAGAADAGLEAQS
jgi:hypothetical protein